MKLELGVIEDAALDLLEQVRAARDQEILDEVEKIRIKNETAEQKKTLASILAGELINLNSRILKLDTQTRLSKLISRNNVQIDRGGFIHRPLIGRSSYVVSTPPLLTSSAELIDGARITDGYVFSTYRPRKNDKNPPKLVIASQVTDMFTGESVKKDLYDISIVENENGPYAALDGKVIEEVSHDEIHAWIGDDPVIKWEQIVEEVGEARASDEYGRQFKETFDNAIRFGKNPHSLDDEQYLFPLGLVIKARQELGDKTAL